MTLHEAILYVLKQQKNPMSANVIAAEVNSQKLYIRSDGNLVPSSQIHTRVNKYPNLFFYNEKREIYTSANSNEDLFEFSRNLHNKLKTIFIHDVISIKKYDLFVPACFFFKRMIDNPYLMQKHLGMTIEGLKGNIHGMTIFYGEINQGATQFQGKLSDLINDITYLDNVLDNKIFSLLENIDLSQNLYSIVEFGQFFNSLFYKDSKQNVNLGQFITTEIVGNLFYKICEKEIYEGIKIYNPGAGFSSIPAIFAQRSQLLFEFVGEEINSDIYILSLMNLISNDIDVKSFFNLDSFSPSKNAEKHDIVICVPPFKGIYPDQIEKNRFPVETNDITLLFIQHAIQKLNNSGKAVLLIPENVLFNSTKAYKSLRKYLITNHFLEYIISLPAGILQPYSGVKTSILILSKKHNTSVAFIEINNLQLLRKFSTANFQYFFEHDYQLRNDQILSEPQANYGNPPISIVPIEKIIESDFDFVGSRYNTIDDLEGSKKTKLEEVLISYLGENNRNRYDMKYVNIPNLNETFYDINLDFIKLNQIKENQNGRIISVPSLLIGSIVPNIKPTFYNMGNGPVIVSANIHAFKVKTNIIDIEYLIYELQTKAFKEQIISRSSGRTSLQRISAKAFLELVINIPSLLEQKEKVKTHKETLYSLKIDEAQRFSQKVGLTAKSEKELLGFMKHEIGNISGGITSDVKNLKRFFVNKSVDFNERISGRTDSSTLGDVFNRLENNINDIDDLMTNIQNIIDFGNSTIQRNPVLFRKFIKDELDKLKAFLKINNIDTYIGFDDEYNGQKDKTILLDRSQFAFVIRNFIVNSVKHGFQEGTMHNIIFNLTEDEDFYYLNLINDGIPFSEGFSIIDFLSFGGRTDNSKGSGLGGYLMGKVVDNHGGEISLMESGNSIFLNEPFSGSDIYFDHTLTTIGVHFLIKLPKE